MHKEAPAICQSPDIKKDSAICGAFLLHISERLFFFLHLFLMLLDQSLLDIVRHELIA